MTARVTHCGKCHDPSDLMLCANCTIALRIELGDVPALLADLDITRSRQDQLTDPTNKHTGGGEIPLPYKLHVSEVVWVLHHTLYSWVATLDGGEPAPRGRFPNDIPTSSTLARYLLVNVARIRVRTDAGQLADEVTSAIHQARHAIDRPQDDRLFLGPCGEQLPNHTICRHEIYGVGWKQTTSCPGCGAIHNIADRQRWLLDVAYDRLGTSTEIAGCLRTAGVRCTPSQIRGYVARGRLTPAQDTDPPLYRMRDVLATIQDRYRHRKATAS
jgi:hypothetical protein